MAEIALVHGQDQVILGKMRRLDLLGALLRKVIPARERRLAGTAVGRLADMPVTSAG